jgi:hypothetical protein
MTKGLTYRLNSRKEAILKHLAKFRKILSPPSCALAAVGRPIVARGRERHSASAMNKEEVMP